VQETDNDMISNQELFFRKFIIKVFDEPGLKAAPEIPNLLIHR
jgi:hypothetical protein